MKKKSQLRLHKKCIYRHKINSSTELLLSGDYGFHLPQIDEANLNTMFAFANASGFIRQ